MLTRHHTRSDEEQWAPVSDLMAVMMLIFMLIAMLLFASFDLEKRNYMEKCEETRNMLEGEFKSNFDIWGAVLEDDLTIRFTNKRVLFDSDSTTIKLWFKNMLWDFFPRYMNILNATQRKYGKNEILAVRIEGHTSSEYINPGNEDPFIKNMELSQNRAREILKYVLSIDLLEHDRLARRLTTANGLSSSQLICTKSCKENRAASRRVEFKLLTNSCQKAGKYDTSAQSNQKCTLAPEVYCEIK